MSRWSISRSDERWSLRSAQLDESKVGTDFFGPGESKGNFGGPNVNISGDKQLSFPDVPGVKGHVDLHLTVRQVLDAMTAVFSPAFWKNITDVVVEPMAGKAGEARSQQPHTIHLNTDGIVQSIHDAVAGEAASAGDGEITPEMQKRIREQVAQEIWETLAHERRHDLDFQLAESKMSQLGEGSVGEVLESAGEQAGKAARSQFRMSL